MLALKGLPAPAKLNLFLQIIGRREDGYSNLQTLFQLVDYGDQLDISVRDDGKFKLDCRASYVGRDLSIDKDSNLVMRAAALLRKATGISAGADIVLHKRIPPGSGLGGGSSDAATTLCALNVLWGCKLKVARLCELGASLGADVPVFIYGRTAWGEGAGERLRKMTLPKAWYLVLLPQVEVKTGKLFAALKLTHMTDNITISDYHSGKKINIFEPLVRQQFPEVAQALDWLDHYCETQGMTDKDCNSTGKARLSGTGCGVFVEFATRKLAEEALAARPPKVDGFVARGVNISPMPRTAHAMKAFAATD